MSEGNNQQEENSSNFSYHGLQLLSRSRISLHAGGVAPLPSKLATQPLRSVCLALNVLPAQYIAQCVPSADQILVLL